jgi:uncharacterized surface protein with fasciclin (FAS1) repeats
MRYTLLVVAFFLVLTFGVFAEAQQEEPLVEESEPTIVEVAQEDGRFTTLVTALEAADLAETLQGEGPFTVFAPTDDAFAALPDGTVEALLDDVPTLTDILLYHVVEGQVPSSAVVDLSSAETLLGQPVVVNTSDGVQINNAEVIIPDIEASNGVIHVVDSVLMPPENDLVETAMEAGSFDTLVTAVQEAGLVETLQGDGPFTVFAPTDEAFAALPDGTLDSLLENPDQLAEVLTYHVVPGRVFSGDVVNVDTAPTVQGSGIDVSVDMGSVMLNESASVIQTDILATNGVVHVIDSVILPPDM